MPFPWDLYHAAVRGDEEKVTELLRQGVDVNYTDWNGNTPLHRASSGGHVGVAELLLKAGAQVDSRGWNGRTPEDIAAITDVQFWQWRDKDRVLEGRRKILELFTTVKVGCPFTYKLKVGPEGGELQNAQCTVTAPPGAVTMETEITCQVINPNDVTLPLKDGEMLVSDIIELGPHGTTFHQPVTVQMQYNKKSSGGAMEAVVWVTEDKSQWTEIKTTILSKDKLSVSVDHFSIFAVISQPKQDQFTVPTEEFTLTSSTQPAVQISFPEQAVNTPTQVTLQVQEIPKRVVEAIKSKDGYFRNLVGTSPIVNVTTESKSDVRIHKPVTVRVPNPKRYIYIQDERPTKMRVMSCEEGAEKWKDETENTNPRESMEFVKFKVSHFARWIVIVVSDITGDTELEPIPLHLCRWLQLRAVQFIMLQSGDDANLFVVECAKAEDAEEKHSALLQKGYKGPLPTNSAIDLFEGQVVEIALLGNVSIPAFGLGSSTKQQITFHSQRGSRHQMQIMALKAKDQHSLDGQGSAAFFALPRVKVRKEEVEKQEGGLEALVQKGCEAVKDSPGIQSAKPELLCQLPIHVPFQTQEIPRGAEGGKSLKGVGKYFYFIKEEVSTDWGDLAIQLGLKWATIKNIAGRNRDDKSRCMDMLQEWKKKKGDAATIEVLMEALSEAGLQSVVDSLKKRFPDIGRF